MALFKAMYEAFQIFNLQDNTDEWFSDDEVKTEGNNYIIEVTRSRLKNICCNIIVSITAFITPSFIATAFVAADFYGADLLLLISILYILLLLLSFLLFSMELMLSFCSCHQFIFVFLLSSKIFCYHNTAVGILMLLCC
jgi:hypothetical protein